MKLSCQYCILNTIHSVYEYPFIWIFWIIRDNICDQDIDSVSGRVTSTMVTTVTPSDQGASVSCTADNSHLVQAQSASVVLDVIGINCYVEM